MYGINSRWEIVLPYPVRKERRKKSSFKETYTYFKNMDHIFTLDLCFAPLDLLAYSVFVKYYVHIYFGGIFLLSTTLNFIYLI